MNESLKHKKILLGVSGGIAAYKALELTRLLRAQGAEVQVVMTRAAQEFVTPLSFQALSGRAVRMDLFDSAAEAAMGHIELARWADLILVAPASADLMARLAHGLAPDLLSTLCLATEAPLLLAPAMNRVMWAHPATQANRKLLLSRGVAMIGPAEGAQACGETGAGRLSEPADLMLAAERLLAVVPGPFAGKKILINAGPTYEDIDPARFIGNRSSGRMGFAIADAARRWGAQTVLIAGPVGVETPAGVRRIDVRSAAQMRAAVLAEVPEVDVFIAAAAIADYRPAHLSERKIKRSSASMQLELVPNADIVAEVAALPNRPFVVGFAAETEDLIAHAEGKLKRKNLDMICANQVGVEGSGFEADFNALTLIWAGGSKVLPHASKSELAEQLLDTVLSRLTQKAKP